MNIDIVLAIGFGFVIVALVIGDIRHKREMDRQQAAYDAEMGRMRKELAVGYFGINAPADYSIDLNEFHVMTDRTKETTFVSDGSYPKRPDEKIAGGWTPPKA